MISYRLLMEWCKDTISMNLHLRVMIVGRLMNTLLIYAYIHMKLYEQKKQVIKSGGHQIFLYPDRNESKILLPNPDWVMSNTLKQITTLLCLAKHIQDRKL